MRTCLALLALLAASPAVALEPKEIVVVCNRNRWESVEVALHYCDARGVARDNLLKLDLPRGEDISRLDYDYRLVQPLRDFLASRKDRIKAVLCVHGVPLRIQAKTLDAKSRAELDRVQSDLTYLRRGIEEVTRHQHQLEAEAVEHPPGRVAETLDSLRDGLRDLRSEEQQLDARRRELSTEQTVAAVDSELMLLWWDDYPLDRWVINPLYFQIPAEVRQSKPPVLLTARLDGPTPALAKRLVDDALAAEKEGLRGKVYVDARGMGYDPKNDTGQGYGGYDESMREAARLLEKGGLSVTLDNQPALFGVDACPDCALYCGWYSLGTYVDSFRFNRGAVAWHLASSEAVSLRRTDTKLWCKSLLEKGACATLGPVAEPYTIGFPKPAEFFGFLATGKYTLAECYGRTMLTTSWMTTLVGDPLYNPYRKTPLLAETDIQPSPKGGRLLRGK